MHMTSGKSGLFIGFTLAVLAVSLCFLPTLSRAGDYDFWVQTPTHWNNKTDRLGQDLKKQVMSQDGDAFIEVYAAKGTNIGVQAIADGMEQAMRETKPYLQNRISSRDFQADGESAILREYTGNYNNIPLRTFALYAYGNGGAFAVFGVFAANQSAKYQDTVYTCVTSLRFSPPGQQTASGTGSPYGSTGSGSPYDNPPAASACDAIVGKWKWFTGSTAEFGPNGTIPGNGKNHWECLDNGQTFRISWNNGQWIDTLTLTQNGQRLEGKNQKGNTVWGNRIGAAPAAPAAPAVRPPASGCERVVGKWHWFTGSTLELGPSGKVPGKHATHWKCLDNGKTYRISWNNGQWIDTLTLTENGQRLEGKNQKGGTVWGNRIGTAPAAVPSTGSTASQTAGTTAPHADTAAGACCSYLGMWDFVPPGIHGVFMPNNVYGERSKSFTYDCSGSQVTIHWGKGESTTWQRQNKDLLTRKDAYGNLVKATRVRDYVVLEGKTYKACTTETPAPSAGTDVPKADKAVKISGNMGAQWGFAHGSLNPSEPSEWKLAATRAITLSFSDPYKKGQQRYTVRVKTPSGSVVTTTQVGLSATLNLSAGTYIVEVTTDIQYAGWRCEWK